MALFEEANCSRNATAPTASDAGVAGAGVSFDSNGIQGRRKQLTELGRFCCPL